MAIRPFLLNPVTADEHRPRPGGHSQRIAGEQDEIRVLPHPDGSHPIVDAADLCRADGDRPQRLLVGQPFPHRQAGAHPQILQGDDRVIGDDADGGARPAHDARVGGGQLPQLRLGTIAEQGTGQHRHFSAGK